MTVRRIALLRGINVGGHRKVPMADLRNVLAQVGLTDVVTYIQSGNVVFGSALSDRAAEALISAGINEHFGFDVPVVVRGAHVLPELLDRSEELHPIVDPATHDKYVMVGFCAAPPHAVSIAAIDPARSHGDAVVVERDHVHVQYEFGQGKTNLTGDYLERVLGVSITMRNLNTIRKLVDLSS